jgi:macrolide-specific efflux system membrane fusion protein
MSRRTIGWIIVVLLGVGAFVVIKGLSQQEKEPVFRTVQVARGDVEATVLATGVVQPQNRLEIKPSISGRAEEILVQEGQAIRKGQILAWMSSTERAALMDAARARGPEELTRWQDLFKPTPLVAPLDGLIIARNVEPGQTVTAQDAVLVMSNRLIIKAQVDETDIGLIKVDQIARVLLDAYPDQIIDGRVDHISYEAKTVNNVTIYEVDILPDRAPDFMRSGMTANVTFVVAAQKNTLFLPAEAIHQENGQPTVLLSTPSNEKQPLSKAIETGLSDGKRVEILSNLQEGDKVLVPVVQIPAAAEDQKVNPFAPFGQRPRTDRSR